MATAAVSLFVATMGRGASTVSPLMPVLASPLLSVHVLLVMGAYTLFTIIAILAATALLRRHSDRMRAALRCFALLYPAVMLLAAGIFVGAIWANQ